MNGEPQSEMILVGYITKPIGLAGEVRVKALAGLVECLERERRIHTRTRSARGQGLTRILTVTRVRTASDTLALTFREVTDRTGADGLRGAELLVPRDSLPELDDEDAFYEADLLGCRVVNADGKAIGLLEEIIETGANDIYRVMDGETETLIPAVKGVVREIDIEGGIITVDWQERTDRMDQSDLSDQADNEQ